MGVLFEDEHSVLQRCKKRPTHQPSPNSHSSLSLSERERSQTNKKKAKQLLVFSFKNNG